MVVADRQAAVTLRMRRDTIEGVGALVKLATPSSQLGAAAGSAAVAGGVVAVGVVAVADDADAAAAGVLAAIAAAPAGDAHPACRLRLRDAGQSPWCTLVVMSLFGAAMGRCPA